MRGIIALGGSVADTPLLREHLNQGGLCVAADGGIVHFDMLGIPPDALVGDMDSVPETTRKAYEKAKLPIRRYPRKKDRTDSEIAVAYALENGCSELFLIGAIGPRPDHVLANQLMSASLAEKGLTVVLTDGISFLFPLTPRQSPFRYPARYIDQDHDVLSLISLKGESSTISLEGFEYALTNAVLPFGSCKGVSNALMTQLKNQSMKQTDLCVCIKSGVVMFIHTKNT